MLTFEVLVSFSYPLGDSAYPLSPFMMTPFRETGNLSQCKKIYNRKVSSVRQTVERAIGHLKGRFRRLRDLNCINIREICYLVMSACILHNLCVLADDDVGVYIRESPIEDENHYPPVLLNRQGGIEKRDALVHHLNNLA